MSLTLEEAMAEMESQFAEAEKEGSSPAQESATIDLDMDLLSRAKSMCEAAKTFNESMLITNDSINSHSSSTNNKMVDSVRPLPDLDMDLDLLSRAKSMCAVAQSLNVQKEENDVNKIETKTKKKEKGSPPTSKFQKKKKSPDKTNKQNQIIDFDDMDHSLLERARAMCAVAGTLTDSPIKEPLLQSMSDDQKISSHNINHHDWCELPSTVAVFTGSSLVTTRIDFRKYLKVGNKIKIGSDEYLIAKKDFNDKGFELTTDYLGESDLEACIFKPKQKKNNQLNTQNINNQNQMINKKEQSMIKNGVQVKDEREEMSNFSLNPLKSHKKEVIQQQKPSNLIFDEGGGNSKAQTTEAQQRALERLRKHKQHTTTMEQADEKNIGEDISEEELLALQNDEKVLYETRVAAQKRAKDKAIKQRKQELADIQRIEAEKEAKKISDAKQVLLLQNKTKERLMIAKRQKKEAEMKFNHKQKNQSKEEIQLENMADNEAAKQSLLANDEIMKARRKETKRRRAKFLDIAKKVEADEAARLEAMIKARKENYQEIVNMHNPLYQQGEDEEENLMHSPQRRAPLAPSSEQLHNPPVLFHRGLNRISPNHKTDTEVKNRGKEGRGLSAPEMRTISSRIPRIRQNNTYENAENNDTSSDKNKNDRDSIIKQEVMMVNVAQVDNDMLSDLTENQNSLSSQQQQQLNKKEEEEKKMIKKKKKPSWKARAPIEISTDYIPVKGKADKGLFDAVPDSVRAITPPKEASAAACKRRQEARNKRNANVNHIIESSKLLLSPQNGHHSPEKANQVKKFTSGDALASLMEQLAER